MADEEQTGVPAPRKLKNDKRKQFTVIAVVVVLVWVGFVVLLSGDGKKKQSDADANDPGKTKLTAINAPGDVVTAQEKWLVVAGNKISEHDGRLAQSETLVKDLQAKIAKMEADRRADREAAAGTRPVPPVAVPTPAPTPPVERGEGEADESKPTPYPPGTPSGSSSGVSPVVPSSVAPPAGPSYIPPPAPIVRSQRTGRVSTLGAGRTGTPTATGPIAASTTVGSGSKNRDSGKTYLPIGFAKVRLLGGIDAPTSGAGQSNPLPVMLRVEDLATLPNHVRANVRDCFIVAAATGDISSERAYFRTERLSCIRHDNRVLETKLSGTLYGEDGKVGLRGRLVSKQGQMLANALLSGVVAGIGRGMTFQTTTTGVTALGTTITEPNSGKEFQAGLSEGVRNAMDRLAEYYISLAEKTYPVIEIDAQRVADVAITAGVEIDVPLPDFDDTAMARRFGTRRLDPGYAD